MFFSNRATNVDHHQHDEDKCLKRCAEDAEPHHRPWKYEWEEAHKNTGRSVLTQDVPEDALALSRTPQTNREGFAKRLREKMRSRAQKKKK